MAKEMRTGVIKFNLKNRMRTYRGQERDFNIKKLVKSINSNETQERVKLGDLNGYYGHMPRIEMGLEPKESTIIDGKIVYLEPCCRTVSLKAFDDGTVEHVQEFFNTELGRKAWERINDKSGGFSAVISCCGGNYNLHGFDYVNEPNYSSNRPYAVTLDGANDESEKYNEIFMLDDVGDQDKSKLEMSYLQDFISIYEDENKRLRGELQLMLDSITNLENERNMLLDDIVIEKERAKCEKKKREELSVSLDDVISKAESFKNAPLEKIEQQPATSSIEKRKSDNAIRRLLGR